MAVYTDREAFIPYRKADIVELCISDGKLSPEDAQKFREFSEILGAYYHFDFHADLEKLKDNFAPYDPDADTKPLQEPLEQQRLEMGKNLVDGLSKTLERANYSRLTDEELDKALNEESLITLNMDIDWQDYEQWILYHRGERQETVEKKKMFGLKKEPFTMDIYERVVMLLKFKDEDYFLRKFKGNKKKVEKLNFTPGKMYIYLYKNIPTADLEVLFPNVRISMNWRDLLTLIVPALGAAIGMLIKILPQLILILGFIAFLCNIDWVAERLDASPNKPVFSVDVNLEKSLAKKELPIDIRKAFTRSLRIQLSDDLKIEQPQKTEWMLTDKKQGTFYFRKERPYLFDITIGNTKYAEQLNNNQLSESLQQAFSKNNYKLAPDTTVAVQLKGDRWLITEPRKTPGYIILKMAKNTLKVSENVYVLNCYRDMAQNLFPLILASVSVFIMIGLFAFKQFIKYKNKKIQFLKDVTDTLFFKNLVCNAGVFNSLIDAAEEEECKEVFLAYYHLLTNPEALDQEALDNLIEEWLEDKTATKIDFNVDKALEKMERLKGKVVQEGQSEEDVSEIPLLTRDANGKCKVLPIDDAKTVIDYVWDNIFQYNVVLE